MILPPTLTRGEILSLQVVVYNYLNVDLRDVSVRLLNTTEFKKAAINPKTKETKYEDITGGENTNILIPFIKAQSGESVNFLITPVQIGLLTLTVKGTSSLAGDTEQKTIRVKSEGIEEMENFGLLIDLRKKKSYRAGFNVKAPEAIVPDSEFCKLQVIGDLFGSSLNNLDRLINRPCGCGEQNMLSLTPNIYALRYMLSMNATDQISNRDELIANAVQNIAIGYQNELSYMHPDGSFSAFGTSDSSGSSWLTAFVVKSFAQAAEFSPAIDPRLVEKSIDWLVSKQQADGSYAEPGNVIHKDMQGGVNSVSTVSAYISIALLESKQINEKAKRSLVKAVSYLESKYSSLYEDRYAMGLIAYALQLANSSKADEVNKK
jgi:CD109 antigen